MAIGRDQWRPTVNALAASEHDPREFNTQMKFLEMQIRPIMESVVRVYRDPQSRQLSELLSYLEKLKKQ